MHWQSVWYGTMSERSAAMVRVQATAKMQGNMHNGELQKVVNMSHQLLKLCDLKFAIKSLQQTINAV